MSILLAFLTGLTTGGLSCLAVQGGLLASSVAHEVERSVEHQTITRRTRNKQRQQPRAARPIVLFLSAKLIAYTILGFFLGLLGSVLQLTPTMRAMLQAAIGVFMVGTALRMFNVHPVFRYFALEPPRIVTRFIRRKAKGEASEVTPLFLGALTVFIPCGVTQAMMAVAMGTGSPIAGATTMFAFILGTSPVFFAVAYLATRLGARLEASFMRVVAVVVLLLGLVSIDAGLTLAGWPYSVANLKLALAGGGLTQGTGQTETPTAQVTPAQNLGQDLNAAQPASPGGSVPQGLAAYSQSGIYDSSATDDSSTLVIMVANNGYSPRVLHARAGQALRLALVTNKTYGCARAFEVPALGIERVLAPTGTELVDVPAQGAGSKLFFSCSMGMYSGVIVFDA